MSKKNVAIVFGVTSNYVSQLANVLVGLKKYSPYLADDIIVFHDGIEINKQLQLNKIGLSLLFTNYNCIVKDILPQNVVETYSACTFSRFECFNLLDKYTKVLWFDVDILIQKDLSGLLKYGETTGFACTVNDLKMLNIANFVEPIPSYSMYTDLYNAGLLVLEDILPNYTLYTDWCYCITKKLAKKLRFGEQGPINLLIQEFSINVELIDIQRFVCHPEREFVHTADIVHSYGTAKFWNSMELDKKFPEWRYNNNQWQTIVAQNTKETMPRLTVLMTVYERSEYLKEAVQSILNQTLSEFELLIVLEYSPEQDRIKRLLHSLNDSRIVIITNESKLGFAASLNVGLDRARGEYIARMDDDDYSVAERLQVQVDFMDTHPDIAIAGSFIQCFGDCEDVWDNVSQDHEHIKVRLLSETQIYHPTAIMRKSKMDAFNLRYDTKVFTEDYDLWARAAEVVKLANIPKVLVRYRSSGTNATNVSTQKVQEGHLLVMRRQIEKHLGIVPTEDELLLLSRRIDILNYVPSRQIAENQKKDFVKKICKSNKGYYDAKILKNEYLLQFRIEKTNSASILENTGTVRGILKHTTTKMLFWCTNNLLKIVKLTGLVEKIKEKVKTRERNALLTIHKMHKETREEVAVLVREIHAHIDWIQRDILVALMGKIDLNALPQMACLTEHPIACESPDHIYPVGTVRDHTRHPRFIKACEDFFTNKEVLSFLDLGCSAGGMVLDAILRGHIGVGLEGSNISSLQQRAEWRLLQKNLFTCDITKPFTVTQNGTTPYIFDVVTAWEVMEHLTPEGVDCLFNNLSKHMHRGSIFVCSISQVDGGFMDDGSPLHQTVKPLTWWEEVAKRHGFVLIKETSFTIFDYARGNGNPSVYYLDQHSYKERLGDCEFAVFSKIEQHKL